MSTSQFFRFTAGRCAVTAAFAMAATAAQANLITNGSFNTDLSGWALSQGGGCGPSGGLPANGALPYSAWVANHVGHAGVVYLNACGTAGDPNIAQVAVSGLTVGTSYELGWDFIRDTLGPQGVFANSFLVELLGIPGSPFGYGYGSTTVWQTNSLTFVATSTTQSIRFSSEANGSDASYFLDNVSLVAVPEPASLALVGLALAGLGLGQRRRAGKSA